MARCESRRSPVGTEPHRKPVLLAKRLPAPYTTLSMTPIKGLELAKACARAANEMQAEDIRIWDLRGLSSLTDFMIVCSGNSMPHLRGILRDIGRIVEDEHGVRPHQAEGRAETRWVVLDFIDVMVHVMHQEMRDLYDLEKLWGDAKEIEWNEEKAAE